MSTTITTSGTISQSGSIISFTPTGGTATTLSFTTPGVTISGTSTTVKLSTDLSLNAVNQYFIIGSNGIVFDGSGNQAMVTNTVLYPGAFKCATAAYSATIQNLGVTVNTDTSTSTLLSINGWVVQGYSSYSGFDANIIVSNCYSTGVISTTGSGGIFGQYSSGTATNCYSTGNISGSNSGGIFGRYPRGTANYCYASGVLTGGSGIFGNTASYSTANYCYYNNSLGINTSGIFNDASYCTANYCYYSYGAIISSQCGAIYRASKNSIANNCYVTVNFSSSSGSGGGIFAYTCTDCTANNCYYTGSTLTISAGIFSAISTRCIANNCYSTCSIPNNCGGIFGITSSNCIANYCYSTGALTGGSGGIFANTATDCSANYCYSNGSISSTSGGIFSSSNVRGTATNCYSTGTITSGGGGIFMSTTSGTAVNCYCIGGTKIGGSTNTDCIGVSGTWLDVSANATIYIGTSGLVWTDISTEVNVPWLLSSYNQAIYDPSFNTISDSVQTYTSPAGLFTSTTIYGGSSISPTYNLLSVSVPEYTTTINTTTGVLTISNNPEGSIVSNILCYYTYNSAKVGYNFSAYTLTAPIPCFLLGTKIKVSPTEYKLIQDLKEGDFVYTSDERVVPILKINHYNVLPNPLSSPYIIPEGYRYGEFVCDQDLYLSPEHAVLIDSDKLVPVKALGFQQDTTLTDLTYFHITLPNFFTDHLVANGIPCESYAGESALQSSGNYISMYFNHEIFKKVYDKQHFIRKNLTFEKYNRIVESTTINLPIQLKALPTHEIIPSGVDFNFAELI